LPATEISRLYTGPAGYVTLTEVEHDAQRGALLYYVNPDQRKLHAVDTKGMQEWEEAVGVLEESAPRLRFAVCYGAFDPVHAGADITEFADQPDFAAIRTHLLRGAALDARMKRLWPLLRTVAIFCGDRYGGSFEWPLFAEWGVADTRCTAQLSEVTLGIIPGWNGVLNVLLKSEATNALYLGQTGNRIDAGEMFAIGLVQRIVDTPDPPDRKAVDPGQWPAVWQEYAIACQAMLLDSALELATDAVEPERKTQDVLAGLEDLLDEVRRRTDPLPYKELRDRIAVQAAALQPDDVEGQKALGREALQGVAKLGKPLAPLGVRAVQEFVQRWNKLNREELLAQYAEAGADESERCAGLMDTPHRVAGVNAVLSKNPVERVPVFD
jgi:enoyl-CoA hydratase/carnithine racemase